MEVTRLNTFAKKKFKATYTTLKTASAAKEDAMKELVQWLDTPKVDLHDRDSLDALRSVSVSPVDDMGKTMLDIALEAGDKYEGVVTFLQAKEAALETERDVFRQKLDVEMSIGTAATLIVGFTFGMIASAAEPG